MRGTKKMTISGMHKAVIMPGMNQAHQGFSPLEETINTSQARQTQPPKSAMPAINGALSLMVTLATTKPRRHRALPSVLFLPRESKHSIGSSEPAFLFKIHSPFCLQHVRFPDKRTTYYRKRKRSHYRYILHRL